MKLKFYYNYNEFIENWENDFKEWNKVFYEFDKVDYLKIIKKKYENNYLLNVINENDCIRVITKGKKRFFEKIKFLIFALNERYSFFSNEVKKLKGLDNDNFIEELLKIDIFDKVKNKNVNGFIKVYYKENECGKNDEYIITKSFFIFYLKKILKFQLRRKKGSENITLRISFNIGNFYNFRKAHNKINNYIDKYIENGQPQPEQVQEQTKETIPTEQIQKPKFKTNITQTELIELVKALIENGTISGTQKDIIKDFADFFGIKVNNPNKLITDIKGRNSESETLFLDKLRNSLMDYIIK